MSATTAAAKKTSGGGISTVTGLRGRIDRVLELRHEVKEREAKLEAALAKAREPHEPELRALREKLAAWEDEALAFAEANHAEVFGGSSVCEGKAAKLTTKANPPRVVCDDEAEAIAAIKEARIKGYVVVKESLDKTAIKKCLSNFGPHTDALTAAGLELEQAWSYRIEPKAK